MSALMVLRRAIAAGVIIEAKEGELRWRSSSPPPETLISEMRDNKPGILKLLLPAPLPGSDPESWRVWHEATVAKWMLRGHSKSAARRMSWGEACNLWHSRYGSRVSRDRCAGCSKPLAGPTVIVLPDAARVHGETCLIEYGSRWQTAAARGLTELGIMPPEERSPAAIDGAQHIDCKINKQPVAVFEPLSPKGRRPNERS